MVLGMTTSTPAPRPPVRSEVVVAVLAFGGIVAAIMQTLVVPLLTELPRILNTAPSNAAWVITATLVAAAVAMPITGRLGDLYGKRRLMLVCASLLLAGSVVCALSSSLVPMIVGRALQGSAMGLIPLGISIMRDVLPPAKLGSAIAFMSSSLGIGGAVGLPVAATIVQQLDWHYLFVGTGLMSVIVIVGIAVVIPRTPPVARGTFDVPGAVGLSTGLICLLLAISKGADWGWGSPTTLGLFAAAAVVFPLWGWFELRTRHPLVDLRVAARPVVLLTNLASVLVGFSMYSQGLIVPQVLQLPVETGYGLGQTMIQMGLWMAPTGLMMIIVSPIGARLSHARSPKTTLGAGATIIAAGYVVGLLLMGSTWGLLLAICVIHVGVGLGYGAMPALIMGSVPLSETASANSVNGLMRSVGTAISAAVIGMVLAHMGTDFGGHTVPSEAGFRVGLVLGCVGAVVAAVVAALIPTGAAHDAEEHVEVEVTDPSVEL